MSITTTGLDKAISRIDKMGLRLRFASMRAVNTAAEETRNVLQRDAEATFAGGITPYIKRGIRFRSGQVIDNGVEASVFLDSKRGPKVQLSTADILKPHIEGGGRMRKNSERSAVRPWYLVPSKYVRLDQYGNVPASYMRNVLSAAGLLTGSGFRQNQTAASRKRGGSHGKPLMRGVYVVPGVGIFQHQASLGNGGRRWATKHGGEGIPLFFFTPQPAYEGGKFDFYWIARTFASKRLPEELRRQLAITIKG